MARAEAVSSGSLSSFRAPSQSDTMSDDSPNDSGRDASEDLGGTIDRLFDEIRPTDESEPGSPADESEPADQSEPADDAALGGPDHPRAPSLPDSARDADLLDDVEIRPLDVSDVPDASAEMLKELEDEILAEGADRSEKVAELLKSEDIVPVIPLGASVTGGIEEVPDEEWSADEAAQQLEKMVRSYLAADDFERGPHYRRIAQLAWRLQDWGQLDPVASPPCIAWRSEPARTTRSPCCWPGDS